MNSTPTSRRARTDRKPRAVTPARWVAWRTIYRTFIEDAWTDRALAGESTRCELDARDHASAQRLAFGTVQQAKLLDYIIAAVGKRPLRKLDPPVLAALRMGVFELLTGSGADDHAAVSQAVEIVRGVVGERAVAFTNAVLRRASVDGDDILAQLGSAAIDDQAVLLSMPEWLVQRMHAQHGEDGIAALAAQNTPTEHTAIRCNTLHGSLADCDAALAAHDVPIATVTDELASTLPEARMVRGSTRSLAELIEQGVVQPQGRASMLAVQALGVAPGERILDLCAAPGGKTMMIAAQLAGRGSVLACDIHEHRVASIAYLAARMHAAGVVDTVCHDAATLTIPQLADRVLVDAPCSGVGVLRRRPDARWKLSEEQVSELAQLQQAILANAAQLVKPGGVVVYATCTLLREECEQVVEQICADAALELVPDPLPTTIPAHLHVGDGEWMARIWPHRVDADGFFIARMRRPT